MPDTTLRVVIAGDSAGARRAFAETEAASDAASSKLGHDMEGATSKVGGLFEKLGGQMSNWGIPFASSVSNIGSKFEEADGKGAKFAQGLSTLGGATLLGLGAGLAGAAIESVHLADGFDQATTKIAAGAGISVDAAKRISDSFLSTTGVGIDSGTALATAYAGVVAQLDQTQGKVLTAAQAHGVMAAAEDASAASGENLNTVTSDLANTMQAFGIKAAGAGTAADILYNAGKLTGQGIDGAESSLAKLHSTLGSLTPPLSQTAGLLDDLTEHGETGRKAMSATNTAISDLVKTASDVPPTAAQVKAAFDSLPASLQPLATQIEQGKISTNDLSTALKALPPAQASLITSFSKLTTSASQTKDQLGSLKTSAAQNELSELGVNLDNAQGKFVSIGSVIAQLQPKLAGMSSAQQLQATQAIFGSTANRQLLDTILAGPGAFDKATDAVSKHDSVLKAAQSATADLHGDEEKLKTTVENAGTSFGEVLIPKLTDAGKALYDTAHWFGENKDVAEALAVVVGGVLTVAVGAFTVNKLADLGRSLDGAWTKLKNLGTTLQELPGKFGAAGSAASDLESQTSKLQDVNVSGTAGEPGGEGTITVNGTTAATDLQNAVTTGGESAATAIKEAMATAGTTTVDGAAAASAMEGGVSEGGGAAAADMGAAIKTAGTVAGTELVAGEESGAAAAATTLGGGVETGASAGATTLGAGVEGGATIGAGSLATGEETGSVAAAATIRAAMVEGGVAAGAEVRTGATVGGAEGGGLGGLENLLGGAAGAGGAYALGKGVLGGGGASAAEDDVAGGAGKTAESDIIDMVEGKDGIFRVPGAEGGGGLKGLFSKLFGGGDEGGAFAARGVGAGVADVTGVGLLGAAGPAGVISAISGGVLDHIFKQAPGGWKPGTKGYESTAGAFAGDMGHYMNPMNLPGGIKAIFGNIFGQKGSEGGFNQGADQYAKLGTSATQLGTAAQHLQSLEKIPAGKRTSSQTGEMDQLIISLSKDTKGGKGSSAVSSLEETAAKDSDKAASELQAAGKSHGTAAADHIKAAASLTAAAKKATDQADALKSTTKDLGTAGSDLKTAGPDLKTAGTDGKSAAKDSKEATQKWITAFGPIAPDWVAATKKHQAAAEKHQLAASDEQRASTDLSQGSKDLSAASKTSGSAADKLYTDSTNLFNAASNLVTAADKLGQNIHVTVPTPQVTVAAPKVTVNVPQQQPMVSSTGALTSAGALSAFQAQGFAEGTITDGPTLAIIGEAGREAVIPQDNPTRAMQLFSQLFPNAAQMWLAGAQAGDLPGVKMLADGGVFGSSTSAATVGLDQAMAALAAATQNEADAAQAEAAATVSAAQARLASDQTNINSAASQLIDPTGGWTAGTAMQGGLQNQDGSWNVGALQNAINLNGGPGSFPNPVPWTGVGPAAAGGNGTEIAGEALPVLQQILDAQQVYNADSLALQGTIARATTDALPALAAVPTNAAALIGDALKNNASGATWLAATGSKGQEFVSLAQSLNQKFGGAFDDGGVVPGSGPVPIVAHGGELILSKNNPNQIASLLKAWLPNSTISGGSATSALGGSLGGSVLASSTTDSASQLAALGTDASEAGQQLMEAATSAEQAGTDFEHAEAMFGHEPSLASGSEQSAQTFSITVQSVLDGRVLATALYPDLRIVAARDSKRLVGGNAFNALNP